MKVLILGASGFIGLPIAQAFSRNGHEVYGSTRSQAKAAILAAEEIIPLVGEKWKAAAGEMDVIIDCAFATGPAAALETLAFVAAASKARGEEYKITYISSSGVWVHGNYEQRNGAPASERSPTKISADLVAWRPAVEKAVLTNPDLNGIVIRPALLYGRTMSLLEPLFKAAIAGDIEWYGIPKGRYSLIHADDLADLYLRVAEAAPICKGITFDAANPQSELVDDILDKLAELSGRTGYSVRKPANAFELAMTTTSVSRPSFGRALVGWVPKKMGLVDGMSIYYNSYVASQKL